MKEKLQWVDENDYVQKNNQLCISVDNNDLKEVEHCLKNGADVHYLIPNSKNGMDVMRFAITKRNSDIIDLFFLFGYDAKNKTVYSENISHFSIHCYTPLSDDQDLGEEEKRILRRLVASGVDFHERDYLGKSAYLLSKRHTKTHEFLKNLIFD